MTHRPSSLYLSPNCARRTVARYADCFGYLVQPRSYSIQKVLDEGYWWAIDNDCFNGGLDEVAWCETLFRYWPHREKCLFVAMPDVVGDSAATLAQFPRYAPHVRAMGYPVALVTQDGLTPDMVPWNELDALFIGGTDIHKLGPEARALIDSAKEREKWVHIGRVNGAGRLLHFWDANSWDGTCLTFGPDKWTPLFARAVRIARAKQQSPNLFEELTA